MTRIKCRYSVPMCLRRGWPGERVYHDRFWVCDNNDCCIQDNAGYEKPTNSNIIGDVCVYCKYEKGEFEKVVKRYSYEYGDLTVCGKTYEESAIDYLEIDGRVLVGGADG